ncbi:MAG: bifunctional tetrahydrofolate synthase/dihydrofolate synthase [Hydrogenophilales bacterium 16-64-46]|nr:MAG: bifunctional tetrahydrofolate synthase/dihydrofolate synthase [Hydrogenophilales bacterium 12-64-13]OYZ05529.1 MAG: bifunctional tetrahydrofolate synthase/dihydrofolate synthase [Hydrogenophilales bacterium 16-64-46]OZA40109.1 MAG: bifunctional tetrahydrofolate synthase/dihydrofolate synthase [Hydrogenophilales bacterium 17-64-34]HQT00375.1 bifunctional tetrahydrofolate synthase/dihydrofolate synthase [Thiobacillus sp.]
MPPPLTASLTDWLIRLERLHPTAIELGLDRVRRVAGALGLKPDFPLLTVGGTNGKGSTCAILEATLGAAGYKIGLYTSPHLLRYNERVRIAGREVGDADLVAAFEAIESARGDISLTYFEFGTLAAMHRFIEAGVDVAILEVGLGGRLDAVNLWDADAALVTSVDLDHQDYLGDTREAIGFEKAGIFRAGRPALCADPDPPASLLQHAQAIGADLRRIGRDFGYARAGAGWTWQGRHTAWPDLPLPAMAGAYQLRNAAAALAALETLSAPLPVNVEAIRHGLRQARVPGRFQTIASSPELIVDVAHNPEAARALASALDDAATAGRTFAVIGMLADKDAAGVIAALRGRVDAWWTCTPDSPRARDAASLAATIRSCLPEAVVNLATTPVEALAAAQSAAHEGDRIVAFGSFTTVAAVLDHAATQQ